MAYCIIHIWADLWIILFWLLPMIRVLLFDEPFASFGVWNKEHLLPNNLASLRPVLAHVIVQTFSACENFTQVLKKTIKFPPNIVPRFKLYIRGENNGSVR